MEPDFPTFSDGTPKANGCLSQFCRCCRFLFLFLLFMVCPTLHIIAPHFCFSFWLVYVLVSPSTSTASFCIPTACVPAPLSLFRQLLTFYSCGRRRCFLFLSCFLISIGEARWSGDLGESSAILWQTATPLASNCERGHMPGGLIPLCCIFSGI